VNAAVTGAAGFVGGHLVDHLRACGDAVRGLVRDREQGARLLGQGCEVVEGRLDDAPVLRWLVEGCDTVFHVAGALAARSEEEFLAVNRDGTARVARIAREMGVARFVYVSSLAVTGPALRGSARYESARPRPVTPYGRSKLAGEEAVRDSGVPFTIVRPAVVYGPRDRQLLRLFKLARLGILPLIGDGRQELSLVYAEDLADALRAAATAPRALGAVYHAAHPEVVTQEALGFAVARAVRHRVLPLHIADEWVPTLLRFSGRAARLFGRATRLDADKVPEFLAAAWTCSSHALARDVGWQARIGLDQGLAATARWYTAEGWL
jgi:nucleoside-diphosphate-sugar epimerase